MLKSGSAGHLSRNRFETEYLWLLDGLGIMFVDSLHRKSNERRQQRNNRG